MIPALIRFTIKCLPMKNKLKMIKWNLMVFWLSNIFQVFNISARMISLIGNCGKKSLVDNKLLLDSVLVTSFISFLDSFMLLLSFNEVHPIGKRKQFSRHSRCCLNLMRLFMHLSLMRALLEDCRNSERKVSKQTSRWHFPITNLI